MGNTFRPSGAARSGECGKCGGPLTVGTLRESNAKGVDRIRVCVNCFQVRPGNKVVGPDDPESEE